VAPVAPITKDDFMATDDFRRLKRGYVDVAELFYTFRLVGKPWQRIAEEEIDREFESGVLAFHDGSDVSAVVAFARKERRKLVMRVVSLLNIIQVAEIMPAGTPSILSLIFQRIAELEKVIAEQAVENAVQTTEIAALSARIAQLEMALPTPPPNNFISMIDFKRHFVKFVHIEMLLTLREVCKE